VAKRWMDQDETWHVGRTRPRPHCARWGPSSPLFCSLAVIDPRVGLNMDLLFPFISILCHSDWLCHREFCPRLDVVYPGRAWSSSPECT